MKKINAFILAAGLGERLRPITDFIPKPLLPICGKPIIEIIIDNIFSLSPERIAINTHYKSGDIIKWSEHYIKDKSFNILIENQILGTGGALKNAERLLRDNHFIVHNSDIFTDIDLSLLIKKHFQSSNIATLAIHNYKKFNNILIDNNGFLRHVGIKTDIESSRLCKVAFMGIAVYSPEIFDYIPPGKSSVTDAWTMALASGRGIGTVDFSGSAWSDIGTPDSYAAAVFDSLHNTGETFYLHSAIDCQGIDFKGSIVIEEDATLKAPAGLKNSILLAGAVIEHNSFIECSIVGRDFLVPFSKSDITEIKIPRSFAHMLDLSSETIYAEKTGIGGSDRSYYRIQLPQKTVILMKCSKDDADFERHIKYTEFFLQNSLPVPELISSDHAARMALFEDLGDMSLYNWLKFRRSQIDIESIYRKVLDILSSLHSLPQKQMDLFQPISGRIFDHSHLRWETTYFLEQFIYGICGMEKIDQNLIEDFEKLAMNVDSLPKTIVHRDMQSQNIMITNNGTPKMIDYQGARLGPAEYDLASLLWDPYYILDNSVRESLLEYYSTLMRDKGLTLDKAKLHAALLNCRLQRHMQALGAYGYLSSSKGKKYFLKHAPAALNYLKSETEATQEEYPHLYRLLSEIRCTI